jgi:saccharopine dehydrogenase-like NADP-dependent oxidoreductase
MNQEKDPPANRSKDISVAVFGAGGAVGSIVTGLLQQSENVSRIFCVDNEIQRLQQSIASWGKIALIVTNGNNYDKLILALEKCFLIVNAANSKLNRWLMKIAWEIGANYLDFASFQNDVAEQKSFSDRFRKKGIAAWINWGVGPGLTNIIAATLIDGLKNCEIKIRVAEATKLAEKDGTEPLIFLWNPELVIDEITSEIYAFSKDPNHARIKRKPFSGPEFYIFPPPIGKIVCYDMNENEVLTLQDEESVKGVEVKSGGPDIERLRQLSPKIHKYQKRNQLQKFLEKLKTPSPKEIKKLLDDGILLDGRIAIAVEVEGENPETGKKIFRRATWTGLSLLQVPQGTTHINFNTAVIAFCAIQLMTELQNLKPGVWAPEQLAPQHREAILQCAQAKTNPVLFQV